MSSKDGKDKPEATSKMRGMDFKYASDSDLKIISFILK
jgi:hypothetical protein